MKNFALFVWSLLIILVGCKKNNSNVPSSTPVNSSFLNPTGVIPSTELEVQNFPFVETLDTSLIPAFGRVTSLPESTNLDVPSPDGQGQGVYESCAGWAVGYGMLSYQYKHIDGYTDYNGADKKFSPYYIWNQLNDRKNIAISIGKALNLVIDQGCCKLDDMPTIKDATTQPSALAKANAVYYKLTEVTKFKTTSIDRMKFYLSKGYPIIVGIYVDDAFRNPQAHPGEKQPDGRNVWKKYSDGGRSGHAVLICGYDNSINAFKVLNSWGTEWGENGYFWIDYDFFKTAVENVIGGLWPEIYIGIIKRPILRTSPIMGITQIGAQAGGTISSDWGISITSRGVCWSTTPNPNISSFKTTDGTGTGPYISNISGLVANTTYHVKAYATNSVGTSYGTQVTFTTSGNGGGNSTVTDMDGNTYHTLTIGTQVWMVENLRVTHYRNGKAISTGLNNAEWSATTSGAYAFYANNATYDTIYGKLYNWYAVADSENIAPAGWHIPSDAEWTILTSFLGGDAIAGGKMKATTLWASPNAGADNSSGFTALPGGACGGQDGLFYYLGSHGEFWSSTEVNASQALPLYLGYANPQAVRGTYDSKRSGLSIRCVKD